jgi:hypothetical protein
VRAGKQWRNQVHSVLQEKLSRCQPGSRRAKRLNRRKAQVSARLFRQQRDLLHQAARTVVDFCAEEGGARIAVGVVRDIQTGVSLGKQTNQNMQCEWACPTLLAMRAPLSVCGLWRAGASGCARSEQHLLEGGAGPLWTGASRHGQVSPHDRRSAFDMCQK